MNGLWIYTTYITTIMTKGLNDTVFIQSKVAWILFTNLKTRVWISVSEHNTQFNFFVVAKIGLQEISHC